MPGPRLFRCLVILVCSAGLPATSAGEGLPPPAVRRLPRPGEPAAVLAHTSPTSPPTSQPRPATTVAAAFAPADSAPGTRPVPEPAAPSPAWRTPVNAAPVVAAARTQPAACGWRRRGPLEVRDGWLLAQPRLTLPAVSPDPLPCGIWQASLVTNRGNDFGWRQTREGELPKGGDRRFLVDGEHQTLEVDLRYGLTSTLSVGARLPVHWRGVGFLDDVIDWWHGWTGLMDNIRSAFTNNLFRVEGRDVNFNRFSWNDETGWGLGNVELSSQWSFLPPRAGSRWSAAVIGRATLPTSTGPYQVGGVDLGLQAVAAVHVARRMDAYAGVGGTWFSEEELDGVRYEPLRGAAFVGFEVQVARTWSALVQLEYSTNLVTNIALYPEVQLYLNVGAKIDLSRRWTLELGVVENLTDQQSTVDFAAQAGLVGRF